MENEKYVRIYLINSNGREKAYVADSKNEVYDSYLYISKPNNNGEFLKIKDNVCITIKDSNPNNGIMGVISKVRVIPFEYYYSIYENWEKDRNPKKIDIPSLEERLRNLF